MTCPNCGAQTSDQATQCPACGTQLTVSPSSSATGAWGTPSGSATGAWGAPSGAVPGGGPGAGGTFAPYPTSEWSNQPVRAAGELAGWWRRVGATIIDYLIVGVVSALIGVAAGRVTEYTLGFVISMVYTVALLVRGGQTLGMMAVGTRCVKDGTGDTLTVGPAVGRYLLAYVLEITVIGGLLDVLWMLWDSKNQTIHDKAVGSLVVRTR
jgi:uncharacterized RDD family membrane protein YckC